MKKILSFIVATIFMTLTFMPSFALDETSVTPGYEFTVDDDGSGGIFYSAGSWENIKNEIAIGGKMKTARFSADVTYKARWCPNIPKSGYYKIYVSMHTAADCAESAAIEVTYGDGRYKYSKRICQKYNSGKWAELGTYFMTAGNATVGNSVCITADKNGVTTADAIKLVYVSNGSDIGVSADFSKKYFSNETLVLSDMKTGEISLASGGKPYYIKGICLDHGAEYARDAGANTIRTYGGSLDYAKTVLDNALSLGMKVVLGLPMKKNKGSYYDNRENFEKDLLQIKTWVDELKEHPALLMWSVCNEIEDEDNVSESVYSAINEVAAYIKSVDAYHPISCTQAGVKAEKISSVMKYCPCIDVLSFNVYKHIKSQTMSIVEKSGWHGGYYIGEFGVDGTWEVSNDKYGVPIEKTDGEKAKIYADRYSFIYSLREKGCFGSFVFASYGVYRASHTWYNMFYEKDGSAYKKSPVYDAMYAAWSGSERASHAPIVSSVTTDDGRSDFEPGEKINISVSASDADGDALTYSAEFRKYDYNNNYEPFGTVLSKNSKISLDAPVDEGIYSLYVYAYDNNGNIGHGKINIRTKKYVSYSVDSFGENAAEDIAQWGFPTESTSAFYNDVLPGGNGIKYVDLGSAAWSGGVDFSANTQSNDIYAFFDFMFGDENLSKIVSGKNFELNFLDGSNSTQAIRIGMYTTESGKMRPFVKAYGNSAVSWAANASEIERQLKKDIPYRMAVSIADGTLKLYVFNSISGGIVCATEQRFVGDISVSAIKFTASSGIGGFQALSQFRVFKANDGNKTQAALMFADLAELDTDIVPSFVNQYETSVDFIGSSMLKNGNVLTVLPNRQNALKNNGSVCHKETDTSEWITMSVTKNGLTFERCKHITIAGSNAVMLAKDDFSSITSLDGYEPKFGFDSQWSTNINNISAAKNTIETKCGINFVRTAVHQAESASAWLCNTMTEPIDVGTHNTYYAKWSFAFDCDSREMAYLKIGFADDQESQLALVIMKSAVSKNPRIGLRINDNPIAYNSFANIGTVYDASMKIIAMPNYDDIIELRVWPHGFKEPLNATVSANGNFTGKYSKVFCNSSSDRTCLFGNFSADRFADFSAVDQAEYNLRNGNPQLIDMCPIGGATFDLLADLKTHSGLPTVTDIAIFNNGERINKLEICDNLSVGVTFENDYLPEDRQGVMVICVAENDGEYMAASCAKMQNLGLESGKTKTVFCPINNIGDAQYDNIKIYIWTKELKPFCETITLD